MRLKISLLIAMFDAVCWGRIFHYTCNRFLQIFNNLRQCYAILSSGNTSGVFLFQQLNCKEWIISTTRQILQKLNNCSTFVLSHIDCETFSLISGTTLNWHSLYNILVHADLQPHTVPGWTKILFQNYLSSLWHWCYKVS